MDDHLWLDFYDEKWLQISLEEAIERAEALSYYHIRKLYGRKGTISPYEFYLADLLKAEGAPELIPQFQFGQFCVDFFVPEALAIIEVDGFYHTFPEKRRRDKAEDEWARRMGYCVLRVSTEHLEQAGPTTAKHLARMLNRRAERWAEVQAMFMQELRRRKRDA